MELEKRYLPAEDLEVRTEDDGSMKISGYAAMFNRKSEDLGGFIEILRPGCFRKALEKQPDIKALFNHDPSSIFARSKNDTLKVEENQTGLKFEAIINPEDEDGKRIYNKVNSGLIDQCSFAFGVSENGQRWSEGSPMTREILEVDLLADVSVVTNPAYPQTTVQARAILQEAGFDFDSVADVMQKRTNGGTVTDEDRDLINGAIMVLQSYLPEEREEPVDDGDTDYLDTIMRELDLVEITNG